ncbi:unnamed protein product [Arctogadus glacialis]
MKSPLVSFIISPDSQSLTRSPSEPRPDRTHYPPDPKSQTPRVQTPRARPPEPDPQTPDPKTPRPQDPQTPDPKSQTPRVRPQESDPQSPDPKTPRPRPPESRPQEPDPQSPDPKTPIARPPDPKTPIARPPEPDSQTAPRRLARHRNTPRPVQLPVRSFGLLGGDGSTQTSTPSVGRRLNTAVMRKHKPGFLSSPLDANGGGGGSFSSCRLQDVGTAGPENLPGGHQIHGGLGNREEGGKT